MLQVQQRKKSVVEDRWEAHSAHSMEENMGCYISKVIQNATLDLWQYMQFVSANVQSQSMEKMKWNVIYPLFTLLLRTSRQTATLWRLMLIVQVKSWWKMHATSGSFLPCTWKLLEKLKDYLSPNLSSTERSLYTLAIATREFLEQFGLE